MAATNSGACWRRPDHEQTVSRSCFLIGLRADCNSSETINNWSCEGVNNATSKHEKRYHSPQQYCCCTTVAWIDWYGMRTSAISMPAGGSYNGGVGTMVATTVRPCAVVGAPGAAEGGFVVGAAEGGLMSVRGTAPLMSGGRPSMQCTLCTLC